MMYGTREKNAIYSASVVPPSLTGFWGLSGLALFVVGYRLFQLSLSKSNAAIVALFFVIVPMAICELGSRRIQLRESTELDFGRKSRASLARCFSKFVGLALCFLGLAFVYWLLPEYSGRFYQHFFDTLLICAPYALVVGFVYLVWLDARMTDPYDGYWQLGQIALGNHRGRDAKKLREVLAGWAVKGFFLPLMFVYFHEDIWWLLHVQPSANASQAFSILYRGIYAVDVTFATVGYLMTFRLFDAHIRSVEPSGLGWLSALACYQPFWGLVGRQYLRYDDGTMWGQLLAPWPMLSALCGTLIIVLCAIYLWATLSFGLRFSNLTNRGILTHGPYAWVKHPAYISKNLSWWLMNLPFVSRESFSAIRQSLRLVMVNGIYALRAYTEERHLRSDPGYLEYEAGLRRRGLWARIRTAPTP